MGRRETVRAKEHVAAEHPSLHHPPPDDHPLLDRPPPRLAEFPALARLGLAEDDLAAMRRQGTLAPEPQGPSAAIQAAIPPGGQSVGALPGPRRGVRPSRASRSRPAATAPQRRSA